MEKILALLQEKMGRLGADYADLRFVEMERSRTRTKNGAFEELKDSASRGVGFRVLKGGGFGFSATADLSEKSLFRHLEQACRMAKSFSKIRHAEVKLSSAKSAKVRWVLPVKKDPWKLSLEEKIAPFLEAQRKIKMDPEIDSACGVLDLIRKRVVFVSSEGSWIDQLLYRTGGWIYGETWAKGEKIRRSWPGPSGVFRAGGYEAVDQMKFPDEAERIREELKELRQSPEAPSGTFDLVLKGSVLALQIHETFGHASESDRVYGYEDNYGGRTFLNPGLLNGYPVASSKVTLVSDAQPPSSPPPAGRGEDKGGGWGAGTFAYDDEGVPAKRIEVLREGVFSAYLTSRETAYFLNQPESSANMVAQDGFHYPIIRMTNLNLLPGQGNLDELIAGVQEGYLLDNELSWSIDQMRLDFQIGGEAGYHIQNGKIKGLVRFPFYHGNTLDFWRSCDRVAGKEEWDFWGFSDCGKGGPYQEAFTGHGLSPARFRNVEFGRE